MSVVAKGRTPRRTGSLIYLSSKRHKLATVRPPLAARCGTVPAVVLGTHEVRNGEIALLTSNYPGRPCEAGAEFSFVVRP